ncbi:MAG: NAD(P)/FAD-dependent oxidoreductase [Rhodospirillales bacterium]|nr:NAD(P)/FAD-dependent oxidoreductase [Rhodospirillales bacterium]
MVVVGAGFGGLTAARGLASAELDVVVIDRHNYHLFQPLLYQVATAALSPAEIASPVRAILSRHANATVLLAKVVEVDKEAREVLLEGGRRISYDTLILATGARHAYFGHDNWEGVAPGLKKIEDATTLRRRILLAFEKAEAECDPAERRALLTFAVIGAGPTGVELAGALVELARRALAGDFRNIDTRSSRILLVEAGPRVLPSMPKSLSSKAQAALERLGVEVRLASPVTECDRHGIVVGTERIPVRTIVWAAGVAASPAARWLGADHDRAGRVKVQADLTLPGHPEIFVIGDTALALQADGTPVPGVAPAAKQQGHHVARTIRARLSGAAPPGPFRYRNLGTLATIGRKSAVADFGFVRLSGLLAWLLWGAVHIFFLIGFRNRIVVLLEWLWAYFTFKRGARLITGGEM